MISQGAAPSLAVGVLARCLLASQGNCASGADPGPNPALGVLRWQALQLDLDPVKHSWVRLNPSYWVVKWQGRSGGVISPTSAMSADECGPPPKRQRTLKSDGVVATRSKSERSGTGRCGTAHQRLLHGSQPSSGAWVGEACNCTALGQPLPLGHLRAGCGEQHLAWASRGGALTSVRAALATCRPNCLTRPAPPPCTQAPAAD